MYMLSHSFVSTFLREISHRYFNFLFEHPSLESAKSRGLRGNVGYVGAWVIIFTWVAWVNFFYVSQNFCG